MKTYEESFADNALKLAEVVDDLYEEAEKRNVEIVLCPQIIDIKEVLKTGIKVYSQHIDDVEFGAHTGHIIPEEMKRLGVRGTLISHSEDMDNLEEIRRKVEIARNLNLESCVCARDDIIAGKIAKFEPNYIAVEPKELIGGNISISTADPDLIKRSLESVDGCELLVGAGVKNQNDVKIAMKLGCKGILVASGVVKADNQKEVILDLLEGFDVEK